MNPSDREFELDERLRDVSAAPDFLARLKSIPETAAKDDAALDAELRAVPVPDDLTAKLHRIAHPQLAQPQPVTLRESSSTTRSQAWKVAIWSTAALVLIALGVAWRMQFSGIDSDGNQFAQNDPHTVIPTPNTPESTLDSDPPLDWLGSPASDLGAISPELSLDPTSSLDSLAEWGQQIETTPIAESPLPPRVASLSERLPSDLLANTFLMRFRPLGANPMIAAQPGRPQMIFPATSPVSYFPLNKGYDRDFLLRESAQPFVSPADTALRTASVPVSTSQASYESVVFSEKPWSTEALANARTEQWLAATGKFFVPAQPRQIELRTAAGPSVFSRAGRQLLQIGVVAGSADPIDRASAHITVAITPPTSSTDTWQPVRIALREMIGRLQPHDTISLVVMSEFPHVLIEDAGIEDSEAWISALDRIESGNSSNLAEGIRLAAATAIAKPGFGDIRRPLVVLSAHFPGLDAATNDQLRPLVEDAAGQGVDFTWVQLEDPHYASILLAPSSLVGLGEWVVTSSLRDLGRLLDRQIHAAPTLIGTQPKISVHWNEKSVAQYRLLGYQPTGGNFVNTSDPQALHALESGSVLFELIMPEEGPNEVARIELQWQDPTGKLRKETQKVSRLQFASSWHASPLSLQAAQLTEQSLALQQNSYFVRRRGNTREELKNWASSLNPALTRHASYPRLELLLPGLPE